MSVLGLVILALVPVIAIFVFAFTNRSARKKVEQLKGWKVADDSTHGRKQKFMHDCYYSTSDDPKYEEQVCKIGYERDDDSS